MHPRLGKQQYKGDVDLEGFAAFQSVCKHPLIYNGDIKRREDILRIQEQFPMLAGIMIGRGLLANPALALEYKENRTLSADEMRNKLHSMHTSVYSQYAAQLEGGEGQLLNKMKTFWEYLAPGADRKLLKAIHKSGTFQKYNQAVLSFLANDKLIDGYFCNFAPVYKQTHDEKIHSNLSLPDDGIGQFCSNKGLQV